MEDVNCITISDNEDDEVEVIQHFIRCEPIIVDLTSGDTPKTSKKDRKVLEERQQSEEHPPSQPPTPPPEKAPYPQYWPNHHQSSQQSQIPTSTCEFPQSSQPSWSSTIPRYDWWQATKEREVPQYREGKTHTVTQSPSKTTQFRSQTTTRPQQKGNSPETQQRPQPGPPPAAAPPPPSHPSPSPAPCPAFAPGPAPGPAPAPVPGPAPAPATDLASAPAPAPERPQPPQKTINEKAPIQQPQVVKRTLSDRELMIAKKEQGNKKFRCNAFDEAIRCYREAMDFSRKLDDKEMSAVLHFNLAMAYDKIGSYTQAADECAAAVKINDQYIKAHVKRAEIYMARGKYEEAVICYEHICEIDSTKRNDALQRVSKAKGLAQQTRKPDQYEILGLTPHFTAEQLKTAYKQKARAHHPDRHSDADVVTRRIHEKIFKEACEANNYFRKRFNYH